MKHLWSPWRLEYLTAPKEDGCIFCHAAECEDDRENLVLLRGERAFLILNRFPYNNGHFLVVPYDHVPSLENLDAPALAEIFSSVDESRPVRILDFAVAPAVLDEFRHGAAHPHLVEQREVKVCQRHGFLVTHVTIALHARRRSARRGGANAFQYRVSQEM